ncbi:hypothetical protein EYC84_004383 [Monilinia fructicola]|uniref:Uncharacterized protein n=1 Tax=Monilinia fructicola TaxID=38448 RepID=A0A5M9K4U6_MONFR|nr:hypothetical protein EYC84_004383 [Monilinia fructicola]
MKMRRDAPRAFIMANGIPITLVYVCRSGGLAEEHLDRKLYYNIKLLLDSQSIIRLRFSNYPPFLRINCPLHPLNLSNSTFVPVLTSPNTPPLCSHRL